MRLTSVIRNKNVLAVIPARGGSKGVVRKNVRPVGGKPLIAWTIEQAKSAKLIDRVMVDTDDAEIADVARGLGIDVPFLRPGELATDDALVIDALMKLIERLAQRFDYLAMLQCTSPLRLSEDIDAAIELCVRSGAPACVSVTDAGKPPQWMLEIAEEGRIRPLSGWDGFRKRRQDLPAAFIPNGAVYIAEVLWLCRTRSFYGPDTVAYVMPRARSIDLDTEEDCLIADALLSARSSRSRGGH
jgi:N-acylneuraminate cytidylyltransferase